MEVKGKKKKKNENEEEQTEDDVERKKKNKEVVNSEISRSLNFHWCTRRAYSSSRTSDIFRSKQGFEQPVGYYAGCYDRTLNFHEKNIERKHTCTY